MADEEETGVVEEKVPKKPIFQNPLVIIGMVLAVQLGIAVVVGNILSGKSESKTEIVEEGEDEEGLDRGNIVMLEDLVVNLKERDRLYYLKVSIGLEVASSEMLDEVEKRQAPMRDIVISTLSGNSIDDFDTIEERNALKVELHKQLSKSLESGDLLNIYFSDFVIQ